MRRPILLCAAGAALLLAAAGSVYVIGPTRAVVLTRLGRPVAQVGPADGPTLGALHLKWPLIEQAVEFDRRERTIVAPAVDGSDASGRPLQASAYLRYRIADPSRFYRRFGDPEAADLRLQAVLEASVRAGLRALPASSDLAQGALGAAQATLRRTATKSAPADGGVAVDDVQLTSLALPDAGLAEAARRMQIAAIAATVKVRADGEAAKRVAMAAADREAADIRGEAERQALEIRGDGDAKRTAILASAYGKDPAFAGYFQRLEAYDTALNPENTALVLATDDAFLKMLSQGPPSR